MLKPKISPTKKHPSIFVSKVATGKLLIGVINNESKYLAIAPKKPPNPTNNIFIEFCLSLSYLKYQDYHNSLAQSGLPDDEFL